MCVWISLFVPLVCSCCLSLCVYVCVYVVSSLWSYFMYVVRDFFIGFGSSSVSYCFPVLFLYVFSYVLI